MNDSQENRQVVWSLGAGMRVVALLIVAGLAGCLAETDPAITGDDDVPGLQLQQITYPGSGDVFEGTPHGVLAVMSNTLGNDVVAVACVAGMTQSRLIGPGGISNVGFNGTQKMFCTDSFALANGSNATVGAMGTVAGELHWYFGTTASRDSGDPGWRMQVIELNHNGPSEAVRAGDHVQTFTAGMWINGTSFYTNIATLNNEGSFPAGYNRTEFGGDALPVYVYDSDRSEQPARSKDTCHFTTIPGYNTLLRMQSAGSTGVHFLLPEEGYTSAGNEDHLLFGEALIFLNTVTRIDESTGPRDGAGDPQGDCFDPENTTGPSPI
jgi:hypothetical protein